MSIRSPWDHIYGSAGFFGLCYTLHMNKTDIEEVLRLHGVFFSMKRRCHHPTHTSYKDYGGRGITVCKEWLEDEAAFIKWCLDNQTESGLHLDRIDNAKGYSPDNCRFVSPQINNRNRRNTLWAEAFGENKPLGAWMEDPRCVIAYPTLRARLRAGWDTEKAITTPSTRPTTRSINV